MPSGSGASSPPTASTSPADPWPSSLLPPPALPSARSSARPRWAGSSAPLSAASCSPRSSRSRARGSAICRSRPRPTAWASRRCSGPCVWPATSTGHGRCSRSAASRAPARAAGRPSCRTSTSRPSLSPSRAARSMRSAGSGPMASCWSTSRRAPSRARPTATASESTACTSAPTPRCPIPSSRCTKAPECACLPWARLSHLRRAAAQGLRQSHPQHHRRSGRDREHGPSEPAARPGVPGRRQLGQGRVAARSRAAVHLQRLERLAAQDPPRHGRGRLPRPLGERSGHRCVVAAETGGRAVLVSSAIRSIRSSRTSSSRSTD